MYYDTVTITERMLFYRIKKKAIFLFNYSFFRSWIRITRNSYNMEHMSRVIRGPTV